MKILRKKKLQGQTLVEVLVAMTVGVLVLTAITSSVLTSLVNSRVSTAQSTANQYVQEGLEIARGSRNAAAGKYCLDKGEVTLSGIPEDTCTTPNIVDGASSFVRTVDVLGNPNDCGTDVNKIISTVKWTDGKCANGTYCHQIVVNSCTNVIAAAGTITPTLTPTPTPVPSVNSFYPIHDAVVNSVSPTAVDGTGEFLITSLNRSAILKFDTSSLIGKYIVSAKLKVEEWGTSSGENLVVRGSSPLGSDGNPWLETTVNYNTRPEVYDIFGSFNFPLGSSIFAIDVTSAFKNGIISSPTFQISNTASDTYIYAKDWRNAPSNIPVLTMQTTTYSGRYTSSPVTIVNSTNGSKLSGDSSPLNISHTVGGSDRMLLLAFTSSAVPTSVTYAGQSMTLLGTDGYTSIETGYYYLLNPPIGTNNVSITISSTAVISAKAITLNNVRQASPFGSRSTHSNNSGTSSSSQPIYSEANDLIIHSTGLNSCTPGTIIPNSVLTEITPQITSPRPFFVGYKLSDSTIFTTSVSWTGSCFIGTYVIGIKPNYF